MKKSEFVKNSIILLAFFCLGWWWVNTMLDNCKPDYKNPNFPSEEYMLAQINNIPSTVASAGNIIAESISAETTTAEPTTAETTAETVAFFTDDECLLLRVASLEAGDQGVEGMALVMLVVLNRAKLYNASIHDVIYAENQFAVVRTEQWNSCYVADGCEQALELVKSGWDESKGALYFCTPTHNSWHSKALTYLYTYKGHEFYK